MKKSAVFLRNPSPELRRDLRENVFKRLSVHGASYQTHDFECVDYDLQDLADDLPMFRGPAVSESALANGDYFCVVGAAHTFGRLIPRPWPHLLSEAVGLPVVNFSGAGFGPEVFLHDKVLKVLQHARFIVLQVMSGRSVGCDEYPGGRRIEIDSETSGFHRLDVLKDMWCQDPNRALHYVRRWNDAYLEAYRRLRNQIRRPTLLLWFSDRAPDDWAPEQVLKQPKWGSLPHLVGRRLYDDVAALFEETHEFVAPQEVEYTHSWVTGAPCPYFAQKRGTPNSFKFYPSSNSHRLLARALTPWALEKRRLMAA